MRSAAGRAAVKALTFFDNSLDIQIAKNIGQIRILNNKTSKPVAKAYVKVRAARRVCPWYFDVSHD